MMMMIIVIIIIIIIINPDYLCERSFGLTDNPDYWSKR
jgi:hypothetical protein